MRKSLSNSNVLSDLAVWFRLSIRSDWILYILDGLFLALMFQASEGNIMAVLKPMLLMFGLLGIGLVVGNRWLKKPLSKLSNFTTFFMYLFFAFVYMNLYLAGLVSYVVISVTKGIGEGVLAAKQATFAKGALSILLRLFFGSVLLSFMHYGLAPIVATKLLIGVYLLVPFFSFLLATMKR